MSVIDPIVTERLKALVEPFEQRSLASLHYWHQLPLLRALGVYHGVSSTRVVPGGLMAGVHPLHPDHRLHVRYVDAALVTDDFWNTGLFALAEPSEVVHALDGLEYSLTAFDGKLQAERAWSNLRPCLLGGECSHMATDETSLVAELEVGVVANWRSRTDALGALSETLVRLARDWTSDFRDLLVTSAELSGAQDHPDLRSVLVGELLLDPGH